jgi:hypothetical protein
MENRDEVETAFDANEWDGVAVNPDPRTDLGYEHDPLTAIHIEQDEERYVLLPSEEGYHSDCEFLIVDPGNVCLLEDWR